MLGYLVIVFFALHVAIFAVWFLSYGVIRLIFIKTTHRISARPTFLIPYLIAIVSVFAWPVFTQLVIDPIFKMNVSVYEDVMFNGMFYGSLFLFIFTLSFSKYREM
jgi:hypothetical protein